MSTNILQNKIGTDGIWFLVGQTDDAERVRYIPIHSTPFTIGRRSDRLFTIPSSTVSGLHAEIVQVGREMAIRDLQSTNGTYVNGKRIRSQVVLKENDLVQFADIAFRARRQEASVDCHTVQTNGCDRALALVQLDNLMRERSLTPYFQPLVQLSDQQVMAYEVLARSRLVGLETPAAMFGAAAQLDLEVELSRMMRWEGVRAAAEFPEGQQLFLNTHPAEMSAEGLFESMKALREFCSDHAITLEIHESAVTDPASMCELREALSDMDIRLAYDDFGSGQARLVELAEVQPDYLKFDISLVQNIDMADENRQQMLTTLVRMTHELGIVSLAEGIETEAEHEVCKQMGFELGQGFFYGKPAPAEIYDNSCLPSTNRLNL